MQNSDFSVTMIRTVIATLVAAYLFSPAISTAETITGQVSKVMNNEVVVTVGNLPSSAYNQSVTFLWETPDGDLLNVGEGQVSQIEDNRATVRLHSGQGQVSIGMQAKIQLAGGKLILPSSQLSKPPPTNGKFTAAQKKFDTTVSSAETKEATDTDTLASLVEQGRTLMLKGKETHSMGTARAAINILKQAYYKALNDTTASKETRQLAANAAYFLGQTFKDDKLFNAPGFRKASAEWYQKALDIPELDDDRRKLAKNQHCYLTKPDILCIFK